MRLERSLGREEDLRVAPVLHRRVACGCHRSRDADLALAARLSNTGAAQESADCRAGEQKVAGTVLVSERRSVAP